MPLQTAIDIIHDIRELAPHVETCLTTSNRDVRDYIIGVATAYWRQSWVITSAFDWSDFLRLFTIFTNR